jgi:hypothetical protein
LQAEATFVCGMVQMEAPLMPILQQKATFTFYIKMRPWDNL